MKLSTAIEDAIRTGKYNRKEEFMCTVLELNYGKALKDQLQELLNEVFPGIRKRPLVNELFKIKGGHSLTSRQAATFWRNAFELTKQWYVWLVFDLKRKGL